MGSDTSWKSLHTLSRSCRTGRGSADKRFVWTEERGRGIGGGAEQGNAGDSQSL